MIIKIESLRDYIYIFSFIISIISGIVFYSFKSIRYLNKIQTEYKKDIDQTKEVYSKVIQLDDRIKHVEQNLEYVIETNEKQDGDISRSLEDRKLILSSLYIILENIKSSKNSGSIEECMTNIKEYLINEHFKN